MTYLTCPHCGARLIGVEQCRDYFDGCLEKEFVDPGYGAVHHLTVPAYMLQHPDALSERGWRESRNVLAAFLIEGKTPAQVRAQIRVGSRDGLDSGRRSWSLTKGPKLRLPQSIQWTRTIAQVDRSSAATYCRDIEIWARAVLVDVEREQF